MKEQSTERKALRSKLLGSEHKPRTEKHILFGEEIELRQPTLGSILSAQNTDDLKTRSIDMIIEYSFVPGTDEHVFEAADAEVIAGWPFGDDLLNLQKAISRLTGIDVDAVEVSLKENPLDGQSLSTASS